MNNSIAIIESSAEITELEKRYIERLLYDIFIKYFGKPEKACSCMDNGLQ